MSEIAVFGGHEDDLTIAAGYLKVAEVAAMYWIEHGLDDSMPIPILYNYRHAIELTLKWLIRLAARYLVRGGYTKENLSPEKPGRKLDTHNVKQLADRLDRYLRLLEIRAPDNRIGRASRQLLDWLDSEDETGQGFRYAVVHDKHGPRDGRPAQVNVSFCEQLNELHQVAELLFDGYTGWLDDYEEVQRTIGSGCAARDRDHAATRRSPARLAVTASAATEASRAGGGRMFMHFRRMGDRALLPMCGRGLTGRIGDESRDGVRSVFRCIRSRDYRGAS